MVLDMTFDFFDHLFNKRETDDKGNTLLSNLEKSKYPTLTLILVPIILLTLLFYALIKIFIYFNKNYKRKPKKKHNDEEQNTYELERLREIAFQKSGPSRYPGNMYIT